MGLRRCGVGLIAVGVYALKKDCFGLFGAEVGLKGSQRFLKESDLLVGAKGVGVGDLGGIQLVRGWMPADGEVNGLFDVEACLSDRSLETEDTVL